MTAAGQQCPDHKPASLPQPHATLHPSYFQVARRYARRGELEARCVASQESLCVHPCRPELAIFRAGEPMKRFSRSNSSEALWRELHALPPELAPTCASKGTTSSSEGGAGSGEGVSGEGGVTGEVMACREGSAHPSVFVIGCDGCASNALAALLELQPGAAMGMPLDGEAWWGGENPSYFSQARSGAGRGRVVGGGGWHVGR